jgi:arginyl-tRNA--protein-N-Asp/Glu arginylyltransferase
LSSEQVPKRRFYATEKGPCPYLPGLEEQRLVTLIEADGQQMTALTEAGFRRSQRFLYKPACPTCQACIPVRIDAAAFTPGRSFRKVLRANADLLVRECAPVATEEQFQLFRRYLASRHAGGGMTQMGRADYTEMIEQSVAGSCLVEMRDQAGRLVGVSLTDRVGSGLSGVYKFFEPDEAARSLGTFVILWHIGRAVELGLPYVYLGYWIKDCRKMAYKSRFMPMERLDSWRWLALTPEEAATG